MCHISHEEMHSKVDYVVAHGISSNIDGKCDGWQPILQLSIGRAKVVFMKRVRSIHCQQSIRTPYLVQ